MDSLDLSKNKYLFSLLFVTMRGSIRSQLRPKRVPFVPKVSSEFKQNIALAGSKEEKNHNN